MCGKCSHSSVCHSLRWCTCCQVQSFHRPPYAALKPHADFIRSHEQKIMFMSMLYMQRITSQLAAWPTCRHGTQGPSHCPAGSSSPVHGSHQSQWPWQRKEAAQHTRCGPWCPDPALSDMSQCASGSASTAPCSLAPPVPT